MDLNVEKININGKVYLDEESVKQKFEQSKFEVNNEGLSYVIIRTNSAGVHAGYVKEKNKGEITLINSRRIWYWDGAFTLSKLATFGTEKPQNCKFSCEVPEITLKWIEIIPCSEKAVKIIRGVEEWKK